MLYHGRIRDYSKCAYKTKFSFIVVTLHIKNIVTVSFMSSFHNRNTVSGMALSKTSHIPNIPVDYQGLPCPNK